MAPFVQDTAARPKTGSDADAFLRTLYSQHSPALRAHAQRMLHDPQLAEDVVQETMLRAWRKLDTLDTADSIGGWLIRVAHNIAIDRIRARRARPTEVDESATDAGAWSVTDHAERTVDSIYVARALQALSPSHRAVLQQVYTAAAPKPPPSSASPSAPSNPASTTHSATYARQSRPARPAEPPPPSEQRAKTPQPI